MLNWKNRLEVSLTAIRNVVAIVGFINLLIVAVGWVGASYSSNPQVFLQWILIVLVALNPFFAFFLLRKQAPASNERQASVTLCRDVQSGVKYLIDLNGRAREIPDDDKDTFSYLINALGFIGDLQTMSSVEIARLRGEKLVAVNRGFGA